MVEVVEDGRLVEVRELGEVLRALQDVGVGGEHLGEGDGHLQLVVQSNLGGVGAEGDDGRGAVHVGGVVVAGGGDGDPYLRVAPEALQGVGAVRTAGRGGHLGSANARLVTGVELARKETRGVSAGVRARREGARDATRSRARR